MSLYLSRLEIASNPSTRALSRLISPDEAGARRGAHHRLIWTAFADHPGRQRDFLWREEGRGIFLTLSARPPKALDLFRHPDVKPFDPQLAPGDQLAFCLRANATRSRKGAGRVDVVMDALHALPKDERAEARGEAAQREGAAWLARQGQDAGFRLQECTVESYATETLPEYRGPRKGAPRFGILDIRGQLEITDADRFLTRLVQGFGRAKAFGCGLMLIRRAG
ncbi:type I-E CRISPR-associated protein Cas6/Cse3/CasE [Sedimentitalea sp. HM32M-2]|uniref:type I-E CRISPR-associated protein Cas6/Cse3/CasE n=1 Tax=Sedimentitalea sp. HM32M-2 TaxID=3351566 RepID=UPI003637D7CD